MIRSSRPAHVILRALAAIVLLALLAGGTAWLIITSGPAATAGASRSANAVDWAARRVVEIVERSIVPDVAFERFEFEAPRTLRFVGLTLTAPDGTRVVEAEMVEVELTAIPTIGQPVLIERIAVQRGLVELIETRGPDGDVGFRGLSPFVTSRPDSAGSDAASPQNFTTEPRFSDVLHIHLVTLDDCGVRYTPASGQPPMRLMGVTTELNIAPEDDGGNRWHGFELSIERGSAMSAALAGRVDLDRLVFELAPSTLRLDLNQGTAEELPPTIQSLLAEYDAHGQLTLSAAGVLPMRDLAQSTATASIGLSNFNIAFGEYRLPIEAAIVEANLADGVATIERGSLSALRGEILISGSVEVFEPGMPTSARWSINGVHLRELLRGGTPEGEAPRLAGLVQSEGTATTHLEDATAQLRGEGTIDVLEGRFAQVEFLDDLFRSISGKQSSGAESTSSELHGVFQLRGPTVDFSSVALHTPVVSARGDGVLWFDGRLDFVFNGGPLERVQDLLGDFGRILGVVTDQLIKYSVTGTVSEPKVGVLPFGIGAQPNRSELP